MFFCACHQCSFKIEVDKNFSTVRRHQKQYKNFNKGETVITEDKFKNCIIAVTGAVGSVGSELVRQLLALDIAELRAIDQDESGLFFLQQQYIGDKRLITHQSDIGNSYEIERALKGVDYLFHAAALKHVPSCERSPISAVQTNIHGMLALIKAAQRCRVKKMLFTSTDKAVCPTNVMGATKLIGERLLLSANQQAASAGDTQYAITRFGNVAGSRGSVIPLFCQQIKHGKPITLTDPRMTRFMMSMKNAVNLVLESMTLSKGGEIFISKMPTVSIADMARVLVQLVAPCYGKKPDEIEIQTIGARPGEKYYEELNSIPESAHMLENDKFLCVLPTDRPLKDPYYAAYGFEPSSHLYHSDREDKMPDEAIREFLLQEGVLPEKVREILLGSAC